MKLNRFIPMVFSAAITLSAAEYPAELQDQNDRVSYALGANFGNNLRSQGVEVEMDQLLKGLNDGLTNKNLLNDQQMRETFGELRTLLTTKQKEKGQKYLEEVAKQDGVQKLESGLLYKVIKPGSGPSPSATDEVTVLYTGKLIDGTVFDSTERRNNQPAKFRVNGVIKGWGEALQKMNKGAVWELYIPSDLAYGEQGRPGIPPNSVLVFNVELVDFSAGTPPPPTPTTAPQQPVTSDIIKVPSAEELKKGAKIEIIKQEDLDKEIAKEKARKEAEEKK